jgi:hypothetical protein
VRQETCHPDKYNNQYAADGNAGIIEREFGEVHEQAL